VSLDTVSRLAGTVRSSSRHLHAGFGRLATVLRPYRRRYSQVLGLELCRPELSTPWYILTGQRRKRWR